MKNSTGLRPGDENWVIAGPPRLPRIPPAGSGAPEWLGDLENRVIAGADFWQVAHDFRQLAADDAPAGARFETPVAFVELVYEVLRLAIRTGALPTGTPLIEAEIGEALSVSRTPVREAMQRLSADGLLSRRKRGWEVKKLDMTQIRESYEVRMSLESFATAQAAIRATEAELAAILEATNARSRLTHADLSERLTSNRDLHNRIYAASGNERLVDLIKKNTQYYFAHRFAQLVTPEESALFQDQHEDIGRALKARDPGAAETAARQHIQSTYLVFEKFYKLL